ncbi:MAG: hypothetical protein KBT44_06855 [Bacteroidales bacterium]|nr:hypothetical protein [Candidatus Equibacterium intestinale]
MKKLLLLFVTLSTMFAAVSCIDKNDDPLDPEDIVDGVGGGMLRLTVKGAKLYTVSSIEISYANPAAPFGEGGARDMFGVDVPDVQLNEKDGIQFEIAMAHRTYNDVQVKLMFTDREPVEVTIFETMELERGEVTHAEITLPEIPGYAAGRLVRLDASWVVQPAELTAKVAEMAGFSADSFQYAFLMMILNQYVVNPVHLDRIIYYTTDPAGDLVEASGVVARQVGAAGEALDYTRLVSFQHGTCSISAAPSYQSGITAELLPVSITNPDAPADRYVALMADYLGYGVSQTADLQHPYMHTKLTGSTCADMLSAAEEFLEGAGITVPGGKVDLVGYSQGGAATIQTLLELESRDFPDERINEVYAGAGPYDLMAFFDFFMNNDNLYGRTGFVSYTFRGICYGENISVDYSKIYNPSLMEKVNLENVFSTKQLDEWHSILGSDMKAVLHPDFFKDNYGGNKEIIRLAEAIESNSVIKYGEPRNVAKIRLYHSRTDGTVPYVCSENLCKAWPNLQEINILKTQSDHLKGGVEFMLDYCGLGDLAALL